MLGSSNPPIRNHYETGRGVHAQRATALDGHTRRIGLLRFGVILVVLAAVVALFWYGLPADRFLLLGVLVLVFASLVLVQGNLELARERSLAGERFHARGLDRLEGRAKPGSLVELLDATHTRFGSVRLAALLEAGVEPLEVVRARQEAVRELASRFSFRERFAIAGGSLPVDTSGLLAWAEAPGWRGAGEGATPLSWVLPLMSVALFVFAPSFGEPRVLAVIPVLLGLAVLTSVGFKVESMKSTVSAFDQDFAATRALVAALQAEPFTAPLLRQLAGRIAATDASVELGRLAALLRFFEGRKHPLFRAFVAPVLLWDYHLGRMLNDWRKRSGGHVRGWLEAVAEFEALVSLAQFAFEHSDATFPELTDADRVEAQALRDPLSPGVPYDLSLAPGAQGVGLHPSLATGNSNLARALASSCALARAGAPVLATRFVLGPLRLAAITGTEGAPVGDSTRLSREFDAL